MFLEEIGFFFLKNWLLQYFDCYWPTTQGNYYYRYEHYLYFEKKKFKKTNIFFRLTFEKWIRFFFFKLPRIFFSSYTSTEAPNHDDTNSISISRNNHHQIDQISKHSNCAGYSHDRYFQFNILHFRENSRK